MHSYIQHACLASMHEHVTCVTNMLYNYMHHFSSRLYIFGYRVNTPLPDDVGIISAVLMFKIEGTRLVAVNVNIIHNHA